MTNLEAAKKLYKMFATLEPVVLIIAAFLDQRDSELRAENLALRKQLDEAVAALADKERIDWLERHNARFNQASIISKSSDGGPPYRCSSGFHQGETIRKAIDAARATQEAPGHICEGGGICRVCGITLFQPQEALKL